MCVLFNKGLIKVAMAEFTENKVYIKILRLSIIPPKDAFSNKKMALSSDLMILGGTCIIQ